MRLTERRENGGKRKWRQIRQENFKREIREKGKTPKRKRDIAGSVEPGKPPARKYDFICLSERVRSYAYSKIRCVIIVAGKANIHRLVIWFDRFDSFSPR